MTASGVIWSPELHLANTLKIPPWHQFGSDKWSRPNTVRKVEFKLLQLHSFFSSFSRGGLRFLRIDSPRTSMRMGIVHQAIEDAIGDGRIADLLVATARPAAGCPMACPERSRRSLAFFARRGDPQQSCVLCEGRFILALSCHPERSEGPMYFGVEARGRGRDHDLKLP